VVIVCPGTYVGQTIISTNRLTIRGLHPWTSILKPATDHPTNSPLLWVRDAHGVKVKWLRVVDPTGSQCTRVGGMITVSNAPNTQIRANKIEATGPNTLDLDCGYESGIRVVNNSDGTHVLWNTITNFMQLGLDFVETDDLLARGNTINYYHPAYAPDAADPSAAGIGLNFPPTGVRIVDNLIRSLSSGGDTTPLLSEAIFTYKTPAVIKGNTMRYVASGITILDTDGVTVRDNIGRVGVYGNGIQVYYSALNNVFGNTMAAGSRGIFVESTSENNNVYDNDFRGPSDPDCEDQSSGGGTAGTANYWWNNLGTTSSPTGICSDT
jgi:parallel beta-helix repeat protein